jgi:hypothetical protein
VQCMWTILQIARGKPSNNDEEGTNSGEKDKAKIYATFLNYAFINFQTRKRKPKGMKNSEGATSKSTKNSSSNGTAGKNKKLFLI